MDLGIIDILFMCFVLFFFISGVYVVFALLKERERYAVKKIIPFFLLIIIIFSGIIFVDLQYRYYIIIFVISFISAFAILILIPLRKKKYIEFKGSYCQIDERDTIFSRSKLKDKTWQYENYYRNNPEKKEMDDLGRSLPGLLSKKSKYYHNLVFAATNATFFTSDHLREIVDDQKGDRIKENIEDINGLASFIKAWSLKMGMHSIGITLLKEHHLYTHHGRDKRYGIPVETKHKYAIAFTVEMDKEFMDTSPYAPCVMESASQYVRSGIFAVTLAEFIRNLGYSARAHIDGNYQLICPLVASDAGLGVIGRMGLLMTPKLGPRVRIGVVTTDLELPVNKFKDDHTITEFCKICKKCAESCPSQSIPFDDPLKIQHIIRWKINSERCYNYWCKVGTDCGRCIMVCPYAHPDTLMHNVVRFGIRNNFIFSRIALKLDDLLYGSKPKSKRFPKWIK